MSNDKDSDQETLDCKTTDESERNGNLAHCLSHKAGSLSSNFLELNLNADLYTDDEPYSAPVEILSEFLSSLMSRDYKSALHYCELILQYEPDNKIVQDFYPLIQERIQLVDGSESDEFADNEGSSYTTKSENSTEYFSSTSAGTEITSACSSFSSEEDEASMDDSQ